MDARASDASLPLDLHRPTNNGVAEVEMSTPTVTFVLWFWNHSLRAHVQMNRICIAWNANTTMSNAMRMLRNFGWLSRRLHIIGVYDEERRATVDETETLEPDCKYYINVCLHNTYIRICLYLQSSLTETTLLPVFLATIDQYVVRPISLTALLSKLYHDGHLGSDWVVVGVQNRHTSEVYDINGEEPSCLMEEENSGATLEFALTLKPWLPDVGEEVEEDGRALGVVGGVMLDLNDDNDDNDAVARVRRPRTRMVAEDVPGAGLHQAIWELLSTTGTVARPTTGVERRHEAAPKPFAGTAHRLDEC
jgi:hypothetical protein